jgi:predicted TIM-barrel fold metal-dependent hydrolase
MASRAFSGTSCCVAAFVIVAFSCVALGEAQAQNRDPNRPIRLHDANGDGKISPEEWPRQNFKLVDKDKDGFLTPGDFAKHWGVPLPGQGVGQAVSDNAATDNVSASKTAQQQVGSRHREPVQWIDTHVHTTGGGRQTSTAFRETVGQARAAIGDRGLAKAILMPTPQLHSAKGGYFTLEGFIKEARKNPEIFAFLGGGGTLNPMINNEAPDGRVSDSLRRRFEKRAEEIIAMGAVGFGEMTALHFSLTDKHPFESVPADHPLFLLLADIAARHDVPIDLHMEPIARDIVTPEYLRGRDNPKELKRNIDGFERLLAHNRKAKIVWAHAGTALLPHRTLELTRELMERHSNLYLQIGVRPGKVKELRILGKNGVKPQWMPLLETYADRIVLGGDQFFSPSGNRGPAAKFAEASEGIRKGFQLLLSSLPPDLARKIGYENAARIYKQGR